MNNIRPHLITTLDQWRSYASALRQRGYTIYQMQYGTYSHEGFHMWFYAPGKPVVEFVTHDADIEKEMLKYMKSGEH